MSTGLIIGLGHIKRQGKDTVARMLNKIFTTEGYTSKIISFSDPLYAVAHMLYGHIGFRTKADYDGEFAAEKELPLPNGMSPRQILLGVGEKLREVDPLIWAQYAASRAKEYDVVLLPDVRHPNECQMVKDSGGILIKVIRPAMVIEMQKNDIDLRLVGYTDWDHLLRNEGSLLDLQTKVELLSIPMIANLIAKSKEILGENNG